MYSSIVLSNRSCIVQKKQEWMFELLNNAITETCDNNTKGYLIDAIPNQLQYIEEKVIQTYFRPFIILRTHMYNTDVSMRVSDSV